MSDQKHSVYQFFEKHGVYMVESGIISADRYMVYIRYKVYLDLVAQGNSSSEAMKLAAQRNNCKWHSIYRSIKYMEDPDWRRKNFDYRNDKNAVRNQDLPKPSNL